MTTSNGTKATDAKTQASVLARSMFRQATKHGLRWQTDEYDVHVSQRVWLALRRTDYVDDFVATFPHEAKHSEDEYLAERGNGMMFGVRVFVLDHLDDQHFLMGDQKIPLYAN